MSFHNLRNIAIAIALLYCCKTQRRSLHRTSQHSTSIIIREEPNPPAPFPISEATV
ncbi:MAG: hypothetical protein V7K98_12095 [Nostoc sp.]|uniref:hypothetical protein n=1 Tax=Nostoc sp. TaxID=1180 RepID=UPI002FFCBE7A